ncbi:MAG: hypothetical protein AAGA46_16005 [Cyanobacteria bacterium P01_F01_bin.13]
MSTQRLNIENLDKKKRLEITNLQTFQQLTSDITGFIQGGLDSHWIVRLPAPIRPEITHPVPNRPEIMRPGIMRPVPGHPNYMRPMPNRPEIMRPGLTGNRPFPTRSFGLHRLRSCC